jgi:hypothetical protein
MLIVLFWHFACAVLNAGDAESIPALKWKPPPGFGSGKLGTPLERMHSANASAPDPAVPGAVEPEFFAPQPSTGRCWSTATWYSTPPSDPRSEPAAARRPRPGRPGREAARTRLGRGRDPFTATVKITISGLRAKLGDAPAIQTVAKAGYRI